MSSRSGATMDRRRWLQGSAVLGGLNLVGLGCCATTARSGLAASANAAFAPPPPLAAIRAEPERLFDITVCLRPFRAAGPRLDTETIGDTLVVHNYGHGGSGWSLSWGSATIAVGKAMANSPREIAVIGGGALGLTSAILAQRAGAQVTIYARDRLPQTRSARATGTWSPDSRIALTDRVDPGFPALWEKMARTSFKEFRNYLGLPGTPVEWSDRYLLSDQPRGRNSVSAPGALDFAAYGDRVRDLEPPFAPVAAGSTPFAVPYVRRSSSMQFNLADYGHTLTQDFLAAGGRFVRAEFHEPGELAGLKEKVVINCPGYGGRALWRDESIVPVRGQIAWLIPQPEVRYGLYGRGVGLLSRPDGIVVQGVSGGDMRGYGNDDETPDRQEALEALAAVAGLFPHPDRAG